MTDEIAAPRPSVLMRSPDRTAILVGVVVAVLVIGAFAYFATRGSDKTRSGITEDVRGQLVTQDVSCRKISFSVPSLTRQQVYACDAKNVAEPNRPNGHIHDSAFTRCYIRAVNGQTVDISHAASIEAKLRGKSVPCR